ncbi:SDR family oxidoreductase [Jeotgalibaca caeni]|uniref:SDR family oxidoreductase n=1 Tax=Jeotgalibaca caeni TaxID=3028623 RepID=UPI00237DD7CA|nr:SDR family oxidoreductase [Jeotgalibaca caeni]MDE1547792.1 SDR family oxidoreductase [Jeotgalibaca caeni]
MKKIILTGGANGIGRALVESFVDKVELYVIDRDQEAGEALEKRLSSPHLHFFYGNLADKATLEAFVNFITEHTSQIDGLIHNAAINHGGLVSKATYEEFMEVLQVNVGTAYYLTQQLEPYFSDPCSIILMSSTRNRQSMEDNESYSSSKGALLSLTHAMANSLRTKARVNTISPGWIETSDFQTPRQAVELSGSDHSQHLVGRVGHPTDIVEMVAFLLDEKKSGFITGQEFLVDGGMSKQMIYHEEHGWNYSK